MRAWKAGEPAAVGIASRFAYSTSVPAVLIVMAAMAPRRRTCAGAERASLVASKKNRTRMNCSSGHSVKRSAGGSPERSREREIAPTGDTLGAFCGGWPARSRQSAMTEPSAPTSARMTAGRKSAGSAEKACPAGSATSFETAADDGATRACLPHALTIAPSGARALFRDTVSPESEPTPLMGTTRAVGEIETVLVLAVRDLKPSGATFALARKFEVRDHGASRFSALALRSHDIS